LRYRNGHCFKKFYKALSFIEKSVKTFKSALEFYEVLYDCVFENFFETVSHVTGVTATSGYGNGMVTRLVQDYKHFALIDEQK